VDNLWITFSFLLGIDLQERVYGQSLFKSFAQRDYRKLSTIYPQVIHRLSTIFEIKLLATPRALLGKK
jgi:hypothetical protein